MFLRVFLSMCALFILAMSFYVYRFYRLLAISEGIIAKTEKYSLSSSDRSKSLLVLWDSTAVWVGAETKEESLPALLSKKIRATYVENHGVSGAVVHDVASQIALIEHDEYDTILLMIGGNDITRFHTLDRVSDEYRAIFPLLPKHRHLIVTNCGNLGWARIFPWFVGRYYEYISRNYHEAFGRIVRSVWGYYVPIFDERSVDPYIREPEKYLAKDLFHPSSIWYAYWFSKIDFSQVK